MMHQMITAGLKIRYFTIRWQVLKKQNPLALNPCRENQKSQQRKTQVIKVHPELSFKIAPLYFEVMLNIFTQNREGTHFSRNQVDMRNSLIVVGRI